MALGVVDMPADTLEAVTLGVVISAVAIIPALRAGILTPTHRATMKLGRSDIRASASGRAGTTEEDIALRPRPTIVLAQRPLAGHTAASAMMTDTMAMMGLGIGAITIPTIARITFPITTFTMVISTSQATCTQATATSAISMVPGIATCVIRILFTTTLDTAPDTRRSGGRMVISYLHYNR